MMEIQFQLILSVCIVYFGSKCVQPHMVDQAVTSEANEEIEVRENFQNLFSSIAKNDPKKSRVYREILKQEVNKGQQVFDAIKDDLMLARYKNADRKRNFYQKSYTDENIVAAKREANEKSHNAGAQHPKNTTNTTAADDVSWERKFQTPVTPIITDVKTQTEAMNKLQNLWVNQQNFFKDIVRKTEELCNKTKEPIEQLTFVFEEIDPLLTRQVKVLTTLPWENTDEMEETVDYELLGMQERSWDFVGRCLTDHCDFPQNQKEELELRKCIKSAKDDLLQRKAEIMSMVKVNLTMYAEPYSEDGDER